MPVLYRHGHALMVDYLAVAPVAAGDVIAFGDELRIAHLDIEAGQLGALAAPSGSAVYLCPKKTGGSGEGLADGGDCYWDPVAKQIVNDDAGGTLSRFGTAIEQASSPATHVMVRHELDRLAPSEATTTTTTTTEEATTTTTAGG